MNSIGVAAVTVDQELQEVEVMERHRDTD
jgi:hypothetical protein